MNPLLLPRLRKFARAALVLCAAASASAAMAQTPSAPVPPSGQDVIEVIFDKQPVENGLTFVRNSVGPVTLNLQDGQIEAWSARYRSEPAMGWVRSFRFNVTDPRFQNGARPVVDVKVTYHNTANASVNIKADTLRGGQHIGGAFGATKKLKTLRMALDDAWFGSRQDPNETAKPCVSGYDLLVSGVNADLNLRSVRIVGYDLEKNVNWGRLLKIKSITAPGPGGVLAYPQAAGQKLTVALHNLARIDCPIHYKLVLTDYDDKIRFQSAGRLKAARGTLQEIPVEFSTANWPLGPYEGRLEIFEEGNPNAPLISRDIKLGVVSNTVLPKARPGDFLYGLDPANTDSYASQGPDGFAYYRLMGVDILRNLWDKGDPRTVEGAGNALARLAAENLQTALVYDPPKDATPEKRAAELPKKQAFLEELARRHAGRGPGKLCFFELGNEPDLPFFYPGEIADYLQNYYGMYDAIKSGARQAGVADTDTVVMNGGLSFAHTDGDRRSREFVKLVDIQKIDAIAYHGHGPGIQAERHAYERLLKAAEQEGKTGKPFIETESGVLGTDRRGLVEQARTVVEKMVYAQSVGMPTFMYFRLFMGNGFEGGYGLTSNFVEPHPSVLSYRNMVERLRHYRYVKALDFPGKAHAKGVDGFLFEERDAAGKPSGRKALVVFSEESIPYDLLVHMDAQGVNAADAKTYDLFGNAVEARVLGGNTAAVRATADPVFLTWTSPGPAATVDVAQPILTANPAPPLLTGASETIAVSVHNPNASPLNAELAVSGTARVPIQVALAQKTVKLAPGQSATVAMSVSLGTAWEPLGLPQWWKVFVDADATQLPAAQLAVIPDSLPGKNGPASGRYTWSPKNRIDFAKIAGGHSEKRPGVAFAYLDAPRVMELPCAASADWWMAWYVNGQKVYDTLEKGNQGGTLASHTFNLPLKAGRNTIAVAVLSGKGAWEIVFGGPKERQIAVTGGNDPDRVEVNVTSGGQFLARQVIPLELREPVPALGALPAASPLGGWMSLEPLAELGSDSIRNLWLKEPDSSRWYKGPNDLSALAWLRDDGADLHLAVAVTDDKLVQPVSAQQPASGDSLRVILSDDAGKRLVDFTGALVANRPAATCAAEGVRFEAARQEQADGSNPVTFYRLTIPKTVVGTRPFRINLSVADYDADFLKQTADLGEIATPSKGLRLICK